MGRRIELTSPRTGFFMTPPLIGRAHNRTGDSHLQLSPLLAFEDVIHTLLRLLVCSLLSFLPGPRGTHTQTPLSNQTPISSDITNHEPLSLPHFALRPTVDSIETKLKTRTANGEERARGPTGGGGEKEGEPSRSREGRGRWRLSWSEWLGRATRRQFTASGDSVCAG